MLSCSAAAALCAASRSFDSPGCCGLAITAIWRIAGNASFSTCIRLPTSASAKRLMPVMLPPGRAKLSMSPASTGSALMLNTIGAVTRAWRRANKASPPAATITAGCERTMSPAIRAIRSPEPSPHHDSIARLRRSTQSSSRMPLRKAARFGDGEFLWSVETQATRSILAGCAAAAPMRVIATTPSALANARRPMFLDMRDASPSPLRWRRRAEAARSTHATRKLTNCQGSSRSIGSLNSHSRSSSGVQSV